MELRLHLLDTFMAEASDGATYKVRAYERMAPNVSLDGADDSWEPTGVTEYRLEDGRVLAAQPDGSLRVAAGGDLVLKPTPARAVA